MSVKAQDLKATTVYLRVEVWKALRFEAIERGIAMTELVRQLLEDHLRSSGYRIGKRLPAIRRGPRRAGARKKT